MRFAPALLFFLATAVVASAASFDAVTEYLLTSAATDFRTHGPKGELQFRNVHRARQMLNAGEERHLLCGEFLAASKTGNDEWMAFATIKTSGYEQWLGETTYCTNPKTEIDKSRDLTAELQSRFDALK